MQPSVGLPYFEYPKYRLHLIVIVKKNHGSPLYLFYRCLYCLDLRVRMYRVRFAVALACNIACTRVVDFESVSEFEFFTNKRVLSSLISKDFKPGFHIVVIHRRPSATELQQFTFPYSCNRCKSSAMIA